MQVVRVPVFPSDMEVLWANVNVGGGTHGGIRNTISLSR